MKKRTPNKAILVTLVLLLFGSMTYSMATSQTYKTVASTGSILYGSQVDVAINASKTIGANSLSLGFQISYGSGDFISKSIMRQLAKDANFKIVRFFDGLASAYIPSMMPCTYFDEATKTGTYDWTNVDDVVGKIFGIGAEPLICLGLIVGSGNPPKVPPGMATNSDTGLPNPESYASYTAEWVKHFKAKGWNVRFYEIVNEPWIYFGWTPNYAKLANYMALFNACAARMRQENPNIFISFDFIGRKPVLDYWLANGGADVDFIDFHKYDADGPLPNPYTDAQMFQRAESRYFGADPLGYSVTQARQVWFNARGKHLLIINSESNFNSACGAGGTDPKIQQMAGAVWTALVLRMGVLNGLSYNVYFELASSLYDGSLGFGMIDTYAKKPWYPYYVNYMIGNNLEIDDLTIESISSSEEIRTLAWIHGQKLNILLICKVDQPRTISLHGVTGQGNITKIDSTISWQQPSMQSGIVNFDEPLVVNGYTVSLLQKTL